MKYIKQIIKSILINTYRLAVQWDLSMLAAFMLYMLTNPLSKKGKYRILVLSKPIFNDDTEAINSVSKDLYFLMFPRLLLAEYMKKYSNSLEPTDDMWTVQYDGTPEQQKIFKSVEKMFTYLHKYLRFDAIFAGNYTYPSQQEFLRVAQKQGIPTIVLYKEGLAPPGSMTKRVSKKLYRGRRFFGSKILVYNNIIKDVLLNAHIPGISSENLAVVGIPRIDKFIRGKNKPKEAMNIVLFAFDPDQKVFRYVENNSDISAFTERGRKFQANIIRFCCENPNYHLTIKSKSRYVAYSLIPKILIEYGINNLPRNIEITSSTPSYDLIRQSTYVLGFTSTTLLEAMIFERPILCPYFHDIIPLERTDFFVDYPEGVNYIKDYKNLQELLNGDIKINYANPEIKNAALKPLLFSLDGNASKRVEMEIINTIKMFKE
jgi:hypothetical protein